MRPGLGTVLRTLGHEALGGSEPGIPTISVVNDGTGSSFTVTISGSDPGSTNTIHYWTVSDDEPVEGLSRTGDGDKQQTEVENHTSYGVFVVSSSGGYKAVASKPVPIHVTSGATKVLNIEAILNPEERGAELEILCSEGG